MESYPAPQPHLTVFFTRRLFLTVRINFAESAALAEVCALLSAIGRATDHIAPGHGKSWNLGRPFSRPGKSWEIANVMESHGKVMENDDNVMGIFTTGLSNSVKVTRLHL